LALAQRQSLVSAHQPVPANPAGRLGERGRTDQELMSNRQRLFWFWVAVLVTLALAIFVVALTAMTRVAA
jgi:hypothetical protein